MTRPDEPRELERERSPSPSRQVVSDPTAAELAGPAAGVENAGGICNTPAPTADVPDMGHSEIDREELSAELRTRIGEDPFLMRFALLYSVECLELECVKALVQAVIDTAQNPEYQRAKRVSQLEEERLLPSRLS